MLFLMRNELDAMGICQHVKGQSKTLRAQFENVRLMFCFVFFRLHAAFARCTLTLSSN